MKKNFILFCILMSCSSLIAQNSKQEKKLIKFLKKEYKLSSAHFKRSWKDNYKYIDLRTNDWDVLIADSLGNIIIPASYPSQKKYINIEYIPEHNRGYTETSVYNSIETCYHVGNKGCFVAKDTDGIIYFIDRAGKVMYEFAGDLQNCSDVNAYLATSNINKSISKFEAPNIKANNIGLLSKDGTTLIPIEYSKIITTSMGLCYVSKEVEGITKQGVINISNTMGYSNVPCLFNKVTLSDNSKDFLVRTHELDTFSVYSPDSVYSCSYIDDGERLYESEQYDKVQKYYSIDNCNVPWANAYLGACSWKLALNDYDVAECELEKLKKTTDINGHDIANTISYHLELFEKEGKKAIEYFELYLRSEDKKYKSRIEEIKYDLIQLLEKSVVLRNSIPHELEAYKYRRDTYLEEERNEMIRKDNERRYQQEQQRLNNQKLHEINERNRIAFELERTKRAEARRRAEAKRRADEKKKEDEKRKEEQKKKESNRTNINSIKLNR